MTINLKNLKETLVKGYCSLERKLGEYVETEQPSYAERFEKIRELTKQYQKDVAQVFVAKPASDTSPFNITRNRNEISIDHEGTKVCVIFNDKTVTILASGDKAHTARLITSPQQQK